MKYPKALLFPMILFQLGILAFMVFNAMRPLTTGTSITFKTRPVDPRDLMRGNYVRLNYNFNRLLRSTIEHDFLKNERLKNGDIIYLLLEPDSIYHKVYKITKYKPKEKDFPFMRAYLTSSASSTDTYFYLKAGIESYYTDKETALALEGNRFRRTEEGQSVTSVEVMLAPDGVARIKEIKYLNTNNRPIL